MEPFDDTYLGDGLYVSFDGFQLRLMAPRGGDEGDHVVYLEPAVFAELLRVMKNHGVFVGLVK